MPVKGFFFILIFLLFSIMGFRSVFETIVAKYLYSREGYAVPHLYLILFYRKMKPMNTIGVYGTFERTVSSRLYIDT